MIAEIMVSCVFCSGLIAMRNKSSARVFKTATLLWKHYSSACTDNNMAIASIFCAHQFAEYDILWNAPHREVWRHICNNCVYAKQPSIALEIAVCVAVLYFKCVRRSIFCVSVCVSMFLCICCVGMLLSNVALHKPTYSILERLFWAFQTPHSTSCFAWTRSYLVVTTSDCVLYA